MNKAFLICILLILPSITFAQQNPVVTFCSALLNKTIEGDATGTDNNGKIIKDHIIYKTGKKIECQYLPGQQYQVCIIPGSVSIKQPGNIFNPGNAMKEWGTDIRITCGNFDNLGTRGLGIKIESGQALNVMLSVIGEHKAILNRKYSNSSNYNFMNWQLEQGGGNTPTIDYFTAGFFSW